MQTVLIEKYREKICSKCEILFPAIQEFFFKKINGKFKLESECKKCKKNRNEKRYKTKRTEILLKRKQYVKNNEKSEKIYQKKYRENNKNIFNRQLWYSNKIKKDFLFKFKTKIRSSIKAGFNRKRFSKKSKTYEILGCTYEEFKIYIEKQFLSWMTWDNHGKYNRQFNFGWDLDHIIPLSNAKTEEDVIRLNHYTNFQPLCSHINRDIKKATY